MAAGVIVRVIGLSAVIAQSVANVQNVVPKRAARVIMLALMMLFGSA
jgi:hypothetical protein